MGLRLCDYNNVVIMHSAAVVWRESLQKHSHNGALVLFSIRFVRVSQLLHIERRYQVAIKQKKVVSKHIKLVNLSQNIANLMAVLEVFQLNMKTRL